MAGEQDIVALGLNIDSFNAQKMGTLKEFIALFNDLSKYDGKIFNPVMGDGLTKFNTSIQQTATLIDQINAKMSSLASGVNSVTAATTANTSATNANTASQNQNNQSNYESIAIQLKNAEAETRLAAAKTKTAQSSLTTYQAELKLAQARLADATGSQKKIRTEEVLVATQKALAAATVTRVFADKQATAAAYQLSVANQLAGASASQSAAQQSFASAAVQQAAVQQQRAASSINIANANISRTAASFTASESAARGFGKTLTGMLSNLRTLAYILPGIGLAGIFNLAFEAIGKAYDALIGFNNQENINLDVTKNQNKALQERIGIYAELIKVQTEYNSLVVNTSALSQQKNLDVLTERGFSKDILMPKEVDVAKQRFEEAKKNLNNLYNLPGTFYMADAAKIKNVGIADVEKLLNKSESRLGKLQGELDSYEAMIGNKGVFNGEIATKNTEKKRDAKKAEYDSEKEQYKLLYGLVKEYYDSDNNLQKKSSDYKKYLEDENRRKKTEIAKENIALNITTQEAILNKDISTEKDKIKAVEATYKEKLKLNKVELNNVTGNLSSTNADIKIARNKKKDDDSKALIKKDEDIYNIREVYRQRYLKATTEINKNQVETDAIAAERIYKNEQKSLVERLQAYTVYVAKKQTLQDLEYAKDKEKHGQTPEELNELESNRDTQKLNAQADVEAQIYNIVYSSLHNQLQLIKETNNTNERENAFYYAKELNDLNDNYEKKKIKFEEYKKELKRINLKYTLSGFDELISDDNEDIKKIRDFLNENIKNKDSVDNDVETTKINLDYVKKSGDGNVNEAQLQADKALGIQEALNKAIIDGKKDLAEKENKLGQDTLNRAKARAQGIADAEANSNKKRKLGWDILKKAEKALYDTIKANLDTEAETRIQNAEDRKDTVDEQKSLEIDAIKESSLAEKDKQALSIQLSQQKLEFDKQADRDVRKMKHDQAVMDKELSIAQIIIQTLLAVMEAAPDVPLEIETAALGAIAVATALATNIPSYADGILSHPGGLARYGEAGAEKVIEPGKAPYIVLKETISYLPKGTEVIPLTSKSPEFFDNKEDDSWAQTRFLAKQIAKNKQEIKNIIKPNIIVDMNWESRKRQILGN